MGSKFRNKTSQMFKHTNFWNTILAVNTDPLLHWVEWWCVYDTEMENSQHASEILPVCKIWEVGEGLDCEDIFGRKWILKNLLYIL